MQSQRASIGHSTCSSLHQPPNQSTGGSIAKTAATPESPTYLPKYVDSLGTADWEDIKQVYGPILASPLTADAEWNFGSMCIL